MDDVVIVAALRTGVGAVALTAPLTDEVRSAQETRSIQSDR